MPSLQIYTKDGFLPLLKIYFCGIEGTFDSEVVLSAKQKGILIEDGKKIYHIEFSHSYTMYLKKPLFGYVFRVLNCNPIELASPHNALGIREELNFSETK